MTDSRLSSWRVVKSFQRRDAQHAVHKADQMDGQRHPDLGRQCLAQQVAAGPVPDVLFLALGDLQRAGAVQQLLDRAHDALFHEQVALALHHVEIALAAFARAGAAALLPAAALDGARVDVGGGGWVIHVIRAFYRS